MKETVCTQALKRAAEAEGGSAALAQVLRVPQGTLERWISGRAQTPLRAFLKVLERLASHEMNGAAAPLAVNGDPLTFAMGKLLARCSRCDGTEFTPADGAAALKLTGELRCRGCGETVVHGDLIARLAQDAVQYSHAMTAARTRRLGARNITTAKKDER
jgi:hypothetical protein